MRESNISQGRLQIKRIWARGWKFDFAHVATKGKRSTKCGGSFETSLLLEFGKAAGIHLCREWRPWSWRATGEEGANWRCAAWIQCSCFRGTAMRDAIDQISVITGDTKHSTWHKELDRLVFQDLTKHRYYMVNKVHDLYVPSETNETTSTKALTKWKKLLVRVQVKRGNTLSDAIHECWWNVTEWCNNSDPSLLKVSIICFNVMGVSGFWFY